MMFFSRPVTSFTAVTMVTIYRLKTPVLSERELPFKFKITAWDFPDPAGPFY